MWLPTLSLANSVWIDQSLSFESSYKLVVDNVYKAASDAVDFMNKANESADLLNSWVEKETHGLIKEIFPHISFDIFTWLVYAHVVLDVLNSFFHNCHMSFFGIVYKSHITKFSMPLTF
ncbi:hypothetical protein POM88_012877 [Heracleum sosnowskyi]|uniref:Serpin domain-containing protein n=1 Tax=Heracleum sosnowskyi TaxID=360622 RepID=A0AAD8IZW0_9APIA|nr:hypothetical protein POM88_012877 [Heracleum sosnowskyi]